MPGTRSANRSEETRQALALADRFDRAPRQNLPRRAHRQRKTAVERKARRSGDGDVDGAVAGRIRRDRDGERAALLGAQRQLLRRGAGERAGRGDRERVIAALAFDIVEIEMQARAVAGQQEPRQRGAEHDRIAHSHVGTGVADLVLAPRHRHDAQRAGEVGDIERDLGGAVGADGDDAGIERQGRPSRRDALQLGALVAARTDRAARALHAVDQIAIEVADVG